MEKEKSKKCFEHYDDGCPHREICIDDPFSKDWCTKKNDYCDNIEGTIGNAWSRFDKREDR